jgi:Serpin (serine protease inhibitor)
VPHATHRNTWWTRGLHGRRAGNGRSVPQTTTREPAARLPHSFVPHSRYSVCWTPRYRLGLLGVMRPGLCRFSTRAGTCGCLPTKDISPIGGSPTRHLRRCPQTFQNSRPRPLTGGAGRTAAEIAQTLHLKGPRAFAAVGKLQRAIARRLAVAAAGDPEPPTLEIANGLFIQQGIPFEPAFLTGPQRYFGVAPETVDFWGNPTGALETINGWVSEHTNGLVPRILDSLPEEMALALASAVYLDADWQRPFKRSKTKPGVFQKANGTTPVDFMHKTESLRYGADPATRRSGCRTGPRPSRCSSCCPYGSASAGCSITSTAEAWPGSPTISRRGR